MHCHDVLDELKQNLWRHYGTRERPAEWDGKVHGGGKLSQRFWEYFVSLEFLQLDRDSVLLDLGGGSQCFFARLVASSIDRVIVVDPAEPADGLPSNVRYVRSAATSEALAEVLPLATHVVSISVFEHVPDEDKRRWMQELDSRFAGETIVLTLEFHPRVRYFQRQDTTRSLSTLLSGLERFYLGRVESSPVAAEDSFRAILGLGDATRPLAVERWRPLALQLRKLPSAS